MAFAIEGKGKNMYKSPIEIITENVKMEVDNGVYKAVTQYGVDVDRDELIKALSYDREQYEKGFRDGYNWRGSEIVRCKDCKKWHKDIGWCDCHSTFINAKGEKCQPWESREWRMFNEDDYCSYAERIE